MIGTSADDVFCTSDTHTFSVDFWKQFDSDRPLDSELSSLRDEGLQTDFAPLHSVGLSPLLSPSLASWCGLSSLRVRSMESWKPLQSHSTGHIQYRVLQYLFLFAAFVLPGYVSEVASGLSLEGLLGFSFGARFGCVCWLVGSPFFLNFFFQVTARAIKVSNKFENAPGPFAAEGDVSSVVTGALPGPLSARCVSVSFTFLYNNNFLVL